MNRELLFCSLCDNFQSHSHHLMLKHIRTAHENDPNFMVYCTICSKSERKWSSLMKHLQGHHKDVDTQSHSTLEDIVIDDGDSDTRSDIQLTDTAGDSIHFQKSESALFLLRATKELSLTHSAVDHLCEFSQSFVEKVARKIHDNVIGFLEASNVDGLREGISEVCDIGVMFAGLYTQKNREDYYKTHFNFVVC